MKSFGRGYLIYAPVLQTVFVVQVIKTDTQVVPLADARVVINLDAADRTVGIVEDFGLCLCRV